MAADCSEYCDKLPGFSFTSFGDWGTCYNDTSDSGIQLFVDMWKEGIIELWRARVYKNKQPYNYEDGVWKTYNGKDWVVCESPI